MRVALRGTIITNNLHVKWDDVVGPKQAKQGLRDAVILPVEYPELFVGARQPYHTMGFCCMALLELVSSHECFI